MSQSKDNTPAAADAIASALKPKKPTQEELEKAATEMLSQQQPLMEEMEAQRLCSIILVDLNGKEIHLKTVMYEMVFELREFLAEHVYTCFFTNFYFEHAGQRLNEYSELSELDLVSNPRIVMKPEKYDERSARAHIKRLVDILENPIVMSIASKPATEETTVAAAPRSRSQSHASQNNAAAAQESVDAADSAEEKKDNQASASQPELTEQDEKLKKSYEEFYEVIRAHQGDQIISLGKKDEKSGGQKVITSSIGTLLAGSIFKSDLNKLRHVKCVNSIEFSSFNPVPEDRKMRGDLFYLTVRTLENPAVEHCITVCVNGFYRNDSSERVTFNPAPAQRTNPCYSYSLAGCLNQLSPLFSKNLQTYLESILRTEPYFISPITQQVNQWLVSADQGIKVSNFEGVNQTICPLFGYDPRTMRDWNEEFQVVQNFPSESYFQRVQKDRAQLKVYQDFVEAAVKGAQAIIEGKLTSLNPNEPVKQHVYVYNQIFFSYAVDTPLSYKDLTSIDQFPSFTQANHDMKGLQQLQSHKVTELHHLATCLVDFKGSRMICQSIIPGILNNNDLSSLAEYGCVDDKKTIVASEQFHEKMLKLADSLAIQVNKVKDQTSGKSLEIAGSIEVKGIKGSDRRDYLVDLQGLVPRDANFIGDEFHSCLVRPELVSIYQRAMNMEYASEHIKPFAEKLDAERVATEPKAEEGKEFTNEQKAQIAGVRQQNNMKKLQEVERLISEAPKFKFNVNVFKSKVTLDMTPAEIEEEEKTVKKLATYLTEKSIPNMVQDLKQQEGIPVDSASLEDFFHKRGMNMRYLGRVLAAMDEHPKLADGEKTIQQLQMMGSFNHIKLMLEREIFLRSAKHVVNRIIKEEKGESDLHLSQVISHCLNCLLAPTPYIQAMNQGKLKPEDEAIQNSFQFFPEETLSPRRNSTNSPSLTEPKLAQQAAAQVSDFEQAANPENLTKKQLKKLKQKQKQSQAVASNEPSVQKAQEKSEMSEILFRQNELSMNDEELNVADLFSQPTISQGLYRMIPPTFVSLTPRQIYEEIKKIALTRYEHALPAEQKKLSCLKSSSCKTAITRDLCKAVGIQLVCDEKKQLLLGNKIKPIVAYLNEQLQQEQAAQNQVNKKKKQAMAQQQTLTEQDVLTNYKYLPFQAKDIGKLFANIKQIKSQNQDVRSWIAQANQAYRENYLDRAFELYSQSINMLLQISGNMSEEVANCITRIASIQHQFGDYLQAIELQTKAIVLQERLLGLDHPQVGSSYATLSIYYHNCGYFSKGFEYLHRALNILQTSVGEYHPEIASIYLKMALVYQEVDQADSALEAYMQHLDQTLFMFGEENIQTASSYQAIALCQYRRQEFRKALESQGQAHDILKKLLSETNQIVVASKQQLDMYFKVSVQYEKQKQIINRPIGTNKQKIDPKFAQLLHEQRLRERQAQQASATDSAAARAEEEKQMSPEEVEQRRQAIMAQMRYDALVQKLKGPKSKRDILDVMEYQHMREQQAEYSRAFVEALATQQQKDKEVQAKEQAAEGEKKQEK